MPDKYTIKNFPGYHFVEHRPRKLLEQISDVIRIKHYSYKTEKSYTNWIKRYILFHNKRHPKEMDSAEVEAFLTHLAGEQNVAGSTQNQALHLLQDGYDIRTVQELPGHKDIKTTFILMYLIEAAVECEVLSILDKLFEELGTIACELKIDQVKEATTVADPSPYSP